MSSEATVPTGAGSYTGVIALIAIGQVVVAIDFCVSSIALGSIGRSFGVGAGVLPLVVTVFSLTYGGLLILGGRMADLFGHRRACIAGLALFAGGSLFSAAAPSFGILVAMRAVEGVGAAMLTPTSFSLINVALPDGLVRNRAYSVFGITQGLSYILAIYIGGALAAKFGWRSCFLLNLPFMFAAAWLAWKKIPAHLPHASRPQIDFVGAVLITAGIGLLMFGLSAAGKSGLASWSTLGPLAGSALALAALAFVERQVDHPLVPPSLFRYPNVVGGDFACIVLVAAASSVFVLLPLFLQRAYHFDVATSGLAMLPYNAAVVLGGQATGMAMLRLSVRQCVAGGALLFIAATLTLCFVHPGSSSFLFVVMPAMLLAAFGATAASLSVMALSTGSVARESQGIASAVLMTCQQVGVALGVSTVFAVMALSAGAGPATAFREAFATSTFFAAASVAIVFLLTRAGGGVDLAETADLAAPAASGSVER